MRPVRIKRKRRQFRKSRQMAKPNYSFEKRRKELEKKSKKEEKKRRKLEGDASPSSVGFTLLSETESQRLQERRRLPAVATADSFLGLRCLGPTGGRASGGPPKSRRPPPPPPPRREAGLPSAALH